MDGSMLWSALAICTGVTVLVALVLSAAIAFGTAPPPAAMPFDASLHPTDHSLMPTLQQFTARDHTKLSYRHYAANPRWVVVLIHGSSAESTGMHALAQALRDAVLSVYVPDLRGHADDGLPGDIDHVGQLDEDLVDLMRLVRRDNCEASVTLAGHSSGGGFALRIAQGEDGGMFARYLLLAPAMHYGAPTWRADAGGWARAFKPRIVALIVLDRLGLRWFQHLTVVAFAVRADANPKATARYSFRMMRNFAAPQDDLERLRSVATPIILLIGEQDECFHADRFEPLLNPLKPASMQIRILPGVTHIGLVTQRDGIATIVAALRAPLLPYTLPLQ